MGWIKNLYGRIAPASKRQLNQRTDEIEDILKQLKGMDKNIIARLERMERLLEMHSYGVTETKRKPQIIVSMTTYAGRAAVVPRVLERLMNQTVKPDRIVLYLSVENFSDRERSLPQRILDMQDMGLELRWCDGDIKSYKKLIPALKEFPNDIIITVDDDLYYDLDIVERLYDSYHRFPKAISALRAHWMKFDTQGKLLPYEQWSKCVSEPLLTPSMRLFATTGGGTLFPPHIFPEETCNADKFMALCGNADDVWFKFMSIMNGVPTVLVSPNKKLQYISSTQEESLWNSNRYENDKQIQAVLKEYQDFRLDGKSLTDMIYEDGI